MVRERDSVMSYRHRFKTSPVWVALACLMVVGMLLAACGQGARAGDPPLPDGWTWYHDNDLSFRAPVPPGWHAVPFARGPSKDRETAHVVDLIPPGTPTDDHRVDGPAERVP